MGSPTIYKYPTKKLPSSEMSERDKHLWEKLQQEKAKNKRPRRRPKK